MPMLSGCATHPVPKIPLLLQEQPDLLSEAFPEVNFDAAVAMVHAVMPGAKFEYIDYALQTVDPKVNYSDTALGLFDFTATRASRTDPSQAAKITLIYAPLGDKNVFTGGDCSDPDAARGEVTAIIKACLSLHFAEDHSAEVENAYRGLASRAPGTYVQVTFGNQTWGVQWLDRPNLASATKGGSVGINPRSVLPEGRVPTMPSSTVIISAGGR